MYISIIMIKELRKSKNMSQKKLARISGLSQSHISEIENEIESPTLHVLDRIATALEIPTHKLFITEMHE